jgi:hypothetical protein
LPNMSGFRQQSTKQSRLTVIDVTYNNDSVHMQSPNYM